MYSIVAITVERYISCCWPHVPPRDNALLNALCILGIVVFSFAYNTTRFFEYITKTTVNQECYEYFSRVKSGEISANDTVTEQCRNTIALEIDMGQLRKDPDYIR